MIQLTENQRTELNKLWFIYGNNGKKHTHGNHRFIQNLLEHGKDERVLYRNNIRAKKYKGVYDSYKEVTEECISAVDKILES